MYSLAILWRPLCVGSAGGKPTLINLFPAGVRFTDTYGRDKCGEFSLVIQATVKQ